MTIGDHLVGWATKVPLTSSAIWQTRMSLGVERTWTCIHLALHGFVLEHQSKGSPGFGSNKEKRPQARILAKARKHLSLATKFDKMARNCEEKRPKFNNKKIKYYRGSARHIVSILYLQQCEFISQALHCMTNFPQHGHF